MEEWKKIINHDNYFVSNYGRVRHGDKFLKGSDNGLGYLRVGFEGTNKLEYIHRLVATAFIPNPKNKDCVNHIDNNPCNNHVDNLEWCTKKENTAWMIKQGRNKRTDIWLKHLNEGLSHMYKPVKGTNIDTGEVLFFPRLNAVKEMGFSPASVCYVCKGKQKLHKGFFWEYV